MHSLFISNLWDDTPYYICWIVAMLFSSCLQEFIQSWVVVKLRETQALIRGVFSLNPLQIYDIPAFICLGIFGVIWGIPIIHTDMLKSYKNGAIIHGSGPAINLIMAFIAAVILFISVKLINWLLPINSYIVIHYFKFVIITCKVNCWLCVLNMMPIPGLDGWGLLEAFIPQFRNMDHNRKNIIIFASLLVLWATPLASLFCMVCELIYQAINYPFIMMLPH